MTGGQTSFLPEIEVRADTSRIQMLTGCSTRSLLPY